MVKKIFFLSLGFFCTVNAMEKIFQDKEYRALEKRTDQIDRINAYCFLGTYFGIGSACCADTGICQTLCSKIDIQPSAIAPLGWQIALTTWVCGLAGVGYSNCILEQKKTTRIEKLIAMAHMKEQKEREKKSK